MARSGAPGEVNRILLVEIETDDGVTGWGEAYDGGPGPAPSARSSSTPSPPALIGADPMDTGVPAEIADDGLELTL